MATVQEQNQDLANPGNPVNQPQAVAGTSGGVGTSQGGQTAGTASAQNQAPVSAVSQNQNPSTGYTDVGTYLNANANQQGGQQLGNQVAQNVTNAYNSTIGDINNSAQAAQSSINSGYTPENTQLIQQVAANPTAAAANPNQISQFQSQLNDQYTGPTSWADTTTNGTITPGYGSLQGEVATAQQNANLQTPGVANVLAQQVEQQLNPGQTGQGINALDTLLLTGNPNAVNTVNQAAAPFAGLNDYLNQQNTNIGNEVTGAQTNAAQAAQDALNAFTGNTGTLTNLNNTINTTAANDLAQTQAQQQQVATDLANLYSPGSVYNASQNLTNFNVGALSPQDIAALGLTQDQANQLQQVLQNAGTSQYMTGHNFGASSAPVQLNLSDYLQQQNPTTLVTPGTVATPQQYAEMAAINQLLGAQAPIQTEALNPAMAAEAGTYTPSTGTTFNLQAALQAAQNQSAANKQAAQQQANAESAAADLAHAESQHGGPFSSIGNFLNNAAKYAENPLQVVPQEIQAAKSKV